MRVMQVIIQVSQMLFKNPIFKTAEAFPKFLIEISYNITK